MKKLIFKRISDRYECVSDEGVGGDLFILLFPPENGRITVGNESFALSEGRVKIKGDLIPDGTSDIKLRSKRGEAHLALIEASRGELQIKHYTDADIFRIESALREISERLSQTELECERLGEKIVGKLTF